MPSLTDTSSLQLSDLRILIVEDDPVMRLGLEHLLEDYPTVAGVLGVAAAILYQQTRSNNTSEVLTKPAPVAAVVALGRIAPEGEIIKLSVPNAQDSRVNQILLRRAVFS